VDHIEMAGFTQTVTVSCISRPDGSPPTTVDVGLTPPPSVIEGYLVNACTQLNVPRAGREMQLWIPPSNPDNQGGTYLASYVTTTEGYFAFVGINPCIVYEVKEVVGSVTTVFQGVLAGASRTTIGSPGVGQKYIFSEATGEICDVRPDPPQ
jgi:hypothetical protein